MTSDWKFQVLHKTQLRSGAQQEENIRLREERAELLQSRNQQKLSDFEKLQDSIKARIEGENYSEYLRREEKIMMENKHNQENKESYKIRREMEQEKKEREQERKESSENLKIELLRQIEGNKVRKQRLLEEKKDLESVERKRLDHLIQAENIQREFSTKLSHSENCEFSSASRKLRWVQSELERAENSVFLTEGWRGEREKIQEKLDLSQTRRDLARSCAAANRGAMGRSEEERTERRAVGLQEVERRLGCQEQYRAGLDQENSSRRSHQAQYRSQISEQRAHNSLLTTRRREYDQALEDTVRRNQKYLQEIDERETQQPLDKPHPFRT